jgi:hypothetical protein
MPTKEYEIVFCVKPHTNLKHALADWLSRAPLDYSERKVAIHIKITEAEKEKVIFTQVSLFSLSHIPLST